MKTSLVIFVGFTILEIISAKAIDSQAGTSPPESKLKTRNPKPSDDFGITDNLSDILGSSKDRESDITIPAFNQLTTTSDPVQLAQQIQKVADPGKRKELASELKQAWNDNRDTLPGKFYQAAYASLLNPEEGAKFWQNELDRQRENLVKSGMNVVDRIASSSGIGGVLGNVQKLAQIDPLGLALLQGDSVLLTVLSDACKNTGKISDLVYDTMGNVVGIHRKVTAPLNSIPVLGDFKNNLDGLVAEGLRRGKYVGGSFANTGTKAFGTLANTSAKRAEEKENQLRQFTGMPKSDYE